MKTTLRSAILTLVLLTMSGLGVEWNKAATKDVAPIAEGEMTLASSSETPADSKISVNISSPTLRLGQSQEVTIKTVPNAEFRLTTRYPNGSINNSLTGSAKADDKGVFKKKLKVTENSNLGIFNVSANIEIDGKVYTDTAQFVVQKWTEPVGTFESKPTSKYTFPISP